MRTARSVLKKEAPTDWEERKDKSAGDEERNDLR
jgi:hypothetical protein